MAEAAAQVQSKGSLPNTVSVKLAGTHMANGLAVNPTTSAPSHPLTSNVRESKPPQTSQPMPSALKMASGASVSSQDGAAESPIDPISRQILQRTQSQHKVSQGLYAVSSSHNGSGPSDEPSSRPGADPGVIRRVDSNTSNKLTKDKKKGVSFLSRIMGSGKKRADSEDIRENDSEMGDHRPAGNDAELFSQPIGFIPRFPAPPKYIKVRAQNRKRKDFDRVFLAQVLSGGHSRKEKKEPDAHIVKIDDANQDGTPQYTGSATRAIWAMEFSKDGKYLAAAGQDKKLRVWTVISGTEDRESEDRGSDAGSNPEGIKLNAPVFRTKLFREYDGHTSSILDLSWSKNNFLLSSSMDKTVRLYHVSRTECLCAFKHNDFVTSIQFHPKDDRFFLAGSLDSKLRLWSIPDKNVAFWSHVPDMVTAVAFTPDGKTALAGCLNGLCILYDTEGLKAHSQIHVRSARGRNAKGSKITGIDTIAVPRANGQHDVKLLITSNDSRVRMYNLKDRTLEIKFRGNENTCSQIHATFSDDGKYVICGSEDRRVYIWPTGPIEKQDPEKRPVEVFEAHSAIVTAALLAPTKTRQLLAQSEDPIYDICNPPPVTLLSRSDSVLSSKAPTEGTGASDKAQEVSVSGRQSASPRRPTESPAYVARNAHNGGNILVTADYTGSIKIFRQDCAYQKRRHDSWDSNSMFSKKVRARSGSVTTKTSVASSLNAHRQSMHFGAKNQSADHIINWRNSISGHSINATSQRNSISEVNLDNERTRSSSPKKSFTQRLSLRHGSTPLADQSNVQPPPKISVSSASGGKSPSMTPNSPPPNQAPGSPPPQDYNPVPHDPDDPLFLQGSQSFMYWNDKQGLGTMVNHQPRTPGLLGPSSVGSGKGSRNPLSRRGSYVSQLSSEVSSSISPSEGQDEDENTNHQQPHNQLVEMPRAPATNELSCHKCGNGAFKAIMDNGERKLRCRRCGADV